MRDPVGKGLTPLWDWYASSRVGADLVAARWRAAAAHPVRTDIESAALEGDKEAIDCQALIADLEKNV